MGYNSRYRIYAGKKCLGTFTGWTEFEAIKRAERDYPNEKITKAIYAGENRKDP